jgi:hypothetical protein
LLETANTTASVRPLNVSNVTYTVPVELTTTVAPWELGNWSATFIGADQVAPPSVVLEITIAELLNSNWVQAT